jgi:hypothetical protein
MKLGGGESLKKFVTKNVFQKKRCRKREKQKKNPFNKNYIYIVVRIRTTTTTTTTTAFKLKKRVGAAGYLHLYRKITSW